ncbi:MAG: glycosyltransferase [Verrucomicrobia bacterium]|nr:glycosyltransferase [Verrucomicrobiota bacterium]
MNRILRPLVFCVSVLVFLSLSLAVGFTDSLAEDASTLIVLYLAMAGTCLLVWAFFPDRTDKRTSFLIIFGLAVISRLLMANFPTSDDVNRYLWEGKLLLAGESPYALTADAPELEKYRDGFWEEMNHREQRTAYPPLVLTVFAGLNLISYHSWIYKLFFGLMDLAVLGMIVRILKMRKLPLRNSLFYALNPITIIAFSGEAHFDSLFIFLVLASLVFWEKGKIAQAWVILGLSIQVKLISVLIIPLLFWKYRSVKVLWILVPLILPSLVFWNDLPNLLEGILHYGETMSHNGSINHLFIDFWGSRELASRLSVVLLLAVILITSLKTRDVLKGSYIIFGALILLSPTVHYWYFSWVLPSIVFFPSLPWLVLLGLSAFYFSAWVQFGKTGEWYQSIGYLRLQWIPFYLLWTPKFFLGVRNLFKSKPYTRAETLSVVIPALNESSHLSSCLKSLQASRIPLHEIVVVDGGSTDDTETIVKSFPVQFLVGQKGRGYQISTGVKASTSDVVLVLHADAQVTPDTPGQILNVLNANPEAVGGAIGQRFISAKTKPVLVMVEALNDFRAQWQGNSFGDQGQFFRRSTLEDVGGFPNIPLMEDVELTTRLKWKGDLVLLGCDLKCSARRWEKDQPFVRIRQVLSLLIRYKVLRLLGKDPSKKLFQEYYSS